MNKQQRNATARREVQKELTGAIKNRLTKGTVVTSTGQWAAFTIRYLGFEIRGAEAIRIFIRGHEAGTVNDAASVALHEWGYTR